MNAGQETYAISLLHRSELRLYRYCDNLTDPLRSLWQKLWNGWRGNLGQSSPGARLFLGPAGTPAFHLLAWFAEQLMAPKLRREVDSQAGEAMLCWYFAVRCQDDMVDDGADSRLVYLEQVLCGRTVRLLADLSGHAEEMLAEWQQLLESYNAASLRDSYLRADHRTSWDQEAIALQGAKYLPMAAPLSALLLRAGRKDLLPWLREVVVELGVGLQLTNDMFGAERDLEAGLSSPFIEALRLRPGLHGGGDLTAAVRRSGGKEALSAYIDRITRTLAESMAAMTAPPRAPQYPSGLQLDWSPDDSALTEHLHERLKALREQHERIVVRASFTGPTVVADLEITRRCNLTCPGCFVRAQTAGADDVELSTEQLSEILEELSGYHTRLHLTGGEPFLHPGIWRVLRKAGELGFAEVVINTNGTLLQDMDLRRLSECGVTPILLISLDGPVGEHDRRRGEGVERAVLEVLARADQLGISASPASILTAELVDFGIDRWWDYLCGALGSPPQSLVLWPLFLPSGSRVTESSMMDWSALEEAADQVAAMVAVGVDVVVADYPLINPLLAERGLPRQRLWQCGAGRGRLCVHADGTISPCHPMRHRLGHIAQPAVAGFVRRIMTHETYHRLGARDHEGCAGCHHHDICGSCQAVVVASGLELFNRAGKCAAYEESQRPPISQPNNHSNPHDTVAGGDGERTTTTYTR